MPVIELLLDSSYLEVHLHQLGKVCADDLVRVHKDHTPQVEWEDNVQEQDLVCPDDTLLVRLHIAPITALWIQ